LEASYVGQADLYEPATGARDLTVLAAESSLSVVATGKGASRKVTADLSELSSGDPIAERSVQFFANCEEIGSGTTKSDGTTSVQVPARYRAPTTSFSAVFLGDEGAERFYDGSTAGAAC
jgi:hypothetical protein